MEDTLKRARKALDSLVYLPSLKGQLPQAGSPDSPPGGLCLLTGLAVRGIAP